MAQKEKPPVSGDILRAVGRQFAVAAPANQKP